MSHRPLLQSRLLSPLAAIALFIPVLGIASQLHAQTEAVPEIENSKFMASGIVNINGAKVLSGPGGNYYATSKLDKGAHVTVVGIKFDYLKIVPPEGSFCYIAKLYVDRRGDGSVGRVNKDLVNIHAGSSLGGMKVVSLCQLSSGADVQILGEQDEYFKIKPPEKAFLYIDKRLVDQDPTVAVKPQVVPGPVAPTRPLVRPGVVQPPVGVEMGTHTDATGTGDAVAPSTNPSVEGAVAETPDAVPATGPSPDAAALAETAFQTAEDGFNAASKQSLDQQPIDELIKAYEALVQNDALAPSLRRIVDARLAALKVRGESAAQLAAVRKSEDEMKKKQMALQAEREELEQRLASSGVVRYTAVGTLQPSSLQQGSPTLYRLTDPATGRTVVYLRSNDVKMLGMVGQFMGVKGNVAVEAQLSIKVVTPTEFTSVDPSKLNASISADIVPPSLLPKTQASSGD